MIVNFEAEDKSLKLRTKGPESEAVWASSL